MAVRKIEAEIERLSLLRDAEAAEAIPQLAKALRQRLNLIAAKSAKIAGERRLAALTPDLLAAFDWFLENGAERDPQCWAKNAITGALREMEYTESALFLRGARHVQMEAVWGASQDTAQTLRGICLLALVACPDIRRGDLLRLLVDALHESDAVVRVEASRALAQMSGEEAALLLRFKARVGDEDPAVIGQVFESLLEVEGATALPFLAEFLKRGPAAARDEAALAMGGSRLAAVVQPLREAAESARDPEFRHVLFRALAISRQPDAVAYLIATLKVRRSDSRAVMEALALHRNSEEMRRQVEAAVAEIPALREEFVRCFGDQ